jgi:hypothetical protein
MTSRFTAEELVGNLDGTVFRNLDGSSSIVYNPLTQTLSILHEPTTASPMPNTMGLFRLIGVYDYYPTTDKDAS